MAKNWLGYERFAVLGLGKSGIAAANLLARRAKSVVASDTRSDEALESGKVRLDEGVVVVSGENRVGDAEVVVVSPGLPPTLAVLEDAVRRGIPIISEVELAFAACRAPFVAITGTDGKTTTTELVGKIFSVAGRKVEVAGNIGTALCDVVESVAPDELVVAELSSFQLWSIHDFRPVAAAFTNIDADHLDYHGSLDEYVRCKGRLIENMGDEDWAVFNAEDPRMVAWAKAYGGRRAGYGLGPLDDATWDLALWYDEDAFFVLEGGGPARIWLEGVSTLPLKGRHNVLNMLCAAALGRSQNVDWEAIGAALRTFEPLKHRLEYVATVEGVRFYDDSKATNVHAALAGLKSLEGLLVPIVGGVDKNLDLGDFARYLAQRTRAVVLIGEITARLKEVLIEAGMGGERIVEASTMEEAVAKAFSLVGGAGTVSLSPACSSFDMFESYAHRGRAFQAAINLLRG